MYILSEIHKELKTNDISKSRGGSRAPPPPPPVILGKKRKKSQKEENPTGQANQNLPPPPPPGYATEISVPTFRRPDDATI